MCPLSMGTVGHTESMVQPATARVWMIQKVADFLLGKGKREGATKDTKRGGEADGTVYQY